MNLYKLDAARGFAVFYVVLHHSLPNDIYLFGVNLGYLFRFGQEAVVLLFLLSGFVINYSYRVGRDKTFMNYFKKRFVRIYIPLFFVFFASYFIKNWGSLWSAGIQPEVLLKNFMMLQDLSSLKPNVIVDPYMDNGPLWSLSYEWWFYMMYFPLIKLINSSAFRIYFVFLSSAIASILYINDPSFTLRIIMYFSIWWVGVCLSDAYLEKGDVWFSDALVGGAALAFVSFVLGLGLLNSGGFRSLGVHPFLEIRHFSFALFFLFFVIFWHKTGWLFFDLLKAPFVTFSRVSYTTYISHYFLLSNASYFSFIDSVIAEKLMYAVVLIVFCYVVELVIYPRARDAIYFFGCRLSHSYAGFKREV